MKHVYWKSLNLNLNFNWSFKLLLVCNPWSAHSTLQFLILHYNLKLQYVCVFISCNTATETRGKKTQHHKSVWFRLQDLWRLMAVCHCGLFQEYKRKLARVTQVRKELRSRLNNLPEGHYNSSNWLHLPCYWRIWSDACLIFDLWPCHSPLFLTLGCIFVSVQ